MKREIQIGQIVIFELSLLPDTPYKYIENMGNGVALCEDVKGNRWQFSYHFLKPANKDLINKFYFNNE